MTMKVRQSSTSLRIPN